LNSHLSIPPNAKELVLLGGGHSHAIFLKMFAMNPIPGLALTLISNVTHTPYSGMLPGLIAGHYDYDRAHIDLRKLCLAAGVRFILSSVEKLDLENRNVSLQNRLPISFDLLSINIGSTPNQLELASGLEFVIPAKPIPQFLDGFKKVCDFVDANRMCRIAIVGGGAGGVELAFNMKKRFGSDCSVTLLDEENEILRTHNPKVRKIATRLLKKAGIDLRQNFKVKGVTNSEVQQEFSKSKNSEIPSQSIPTDFTFWVTHASPESWLEKAGLRCDAGGFVLIGDTLQSVSHEFVFAVGDTATMANNPRPKTGVFAVRQGAPLFKNIELYLRKRQLQKYKPQSKFLGLIGTGDLAAIASYGDGFAMHAGFLWKLKDYIDQKFMDQFSNMSPMALGAVDDSQVSSDSVLAELSKQSQMRCTGCAGKIEGNILHESLGRVKSEGHNDEKLQKVIRGLDDLDDAAMIQVSPGKNLVQSVDYLSALISDPYLFGQIALNHSFSDIYAMGAKPSSAQILALVPFASNHIMTENIFQMISGVVKQLSLADSTLIGGHTAEAAGLALGIIANGEVDASTVLRKSNLRPGDHLILTKPLGIGTLFAAEMRSQTIGRWIDSAIESMLISNEKASQTFRDFGVSACTDITGFGLAGHLLEMLRASKVSARVNLDEIPVLEGAAELIAGGFTSSIHDSNQLNDKFISCTANEESHENYSLLFDPQTSGGLLAGVKPEDSERCLLALRESGHDASLIGKVLESTDPSPNISFS